MDVDVDPEDDVAFARELQRGELDVDSNGDEDDNEEVVMDVGRWGSRNDDTQSWLYVPLIRAALGMEGPNEDASNFMPVQHWNQLVEVFRTDFNARGIVSNDLPFSPNGYLPQGEQERLLHCELDNPPGDSGIDVEHPARDLLEMVVLLARDAWRDADNIVNHILLSPYLINPQHWV